MIEVVAGVLQRSSGHILCALRGEDMTKPGVWEFPGGKIEEGESHEDALQRELLEELDCHVKVGSFLHDTVIGNIHLFFYQGEIASGEPTALEHEDIRWVLPKDLQQLPWAEADFKMVHLLSQDVKNI